MQNIANFLGFRNFGLQIGQNYGNIHVQSSMRDEPTNHRDMAEKWRQILFITDPEVDREKTKSAKGKRVAKTCEWIIKHPKFLKWQEDDHGSLLWICGGPGKGKTMLSIYLTEWLELSNKDGRTNVLYFFCDHRDKTRNSDIAILRGLLVQLLRLQPSLSSYVSHRGDPNNRFITSRDALWLLLRAMLQDKHRHPTKCVIDGVDECNEDCLTWLCERITEDMPCQFLIVSRKHIAFKCWPTIDLDSTEMMEIGSDIIHYIRDRTKSISELLGCTEAFRQWLNDQLLVRCGWSFLWLGFVIQALLRQKTCSDVKITLERFPSELKLLYDRILLDIKPDHRDTCATILKWAVHATAPVTLLEMADILNIKESRIMSVDQAVRDRVKWCEPLIRLQTSLDDDDTKVWIVPIHFSLTEYLMEPLEGDEPVLQSFKFHFDEANFDLALTCFEYLKFKFAGKARWSYKDAALKQKHPFMTYATRYFGVHASCAQSLASRFLLEQFNSNGQSLIQAWWVSYSPMVFSDHVVQKYIEAARKNKLQPAIHVAARFGMVQFAKDYLANAGSPEQVKSLVNEEDANGCTPLRFAIDCGYSGLVNLLLRNGAVADGSSVFWAACEDTYKLLRHIYATATDADLADNDTKVEHLTKKMDEHLAEVDDDDHPNAFWRRFNISPTPASESRESIVRMLLLKVHKDIEYPNWLHKALSWNVMLGRETMVRILIDYVPNYTPGSGREYSLLFCAITEFKSSSVLELIIDRLDIDPARIVNDHPIVRLGDALLLCAFRYGHLAVICYLLQRGARLDIPRYLGPGLLHLAAHTGHVDLLNLVLQRGVNINKKHDHSSVLHVASEAGQEKMVQQLIKLGAHVNATNVLGETSLMLAAGQGHAKTVEAILGGGASINIKSQRSRTALDMARAEGREQVVTILEKYGKVKGKLSR
jgi:ankyrin repeat protein